MPAPLIDFAFGATTIITVLTGVTWAYDLGAKHGWWSA